MDVWIGPHINWIGPFQLAEKILFRLDKYEDDRVHQFGEWLAFGKTRHLPEPEQKKTLLYRFCEWVHSKRTRNVRVNIHEYDTWSMDHTLSYIILPMLKQLKATKHGAPFVDLDDVPANLRPTEEDLAKAAADFGYTDDNFHARWDWILDEMIWSFTQEQNPESESVFFTHPPEEEAAKMTFEQQLGAMKIDQAGLDAHAARKQNGFRLFGKYYQALWD